MYWNGCWKSRLYFKSLIEVKRRLRGYGLQILDSAGCCAGNCIFACNVGGYISATNNNRNVTIRCRMVEKKTTGRCFCWCKHTRIRKTTRVNQWAYKVILVLSNFTRSVFEKCRHARLTRYNPMLQHSTFVLHGHSENRHCTRSGSNHRNGR